MIYLIIRNMQVQDLNAEGNGYTLGASMLITSAVGFAEAFRRQVPDLVSRINGVAVALSDFHLHGTKAGPFYRLSQTRNPIAMKIPGITTEKLLNPPIQAEAKANATISLVLQLQATGLHQSIIDALDAWLPKTRFAGGFICRYDSIDKPFAARRDIFNSIRNWGSTTRFFVDRADILTSRDDGTDALDAFLDAMAVTMHDGVWRRAQPGWIVPIAVGYQGIEYPTDRPGRRDSGTPHMYASPLTGLAELVTASRIARNSQSNDSYPIFFRQYWRSESATSFVSARHPQSLATQETLDG